VCVRKTIRDLSQGRTPKPGFGQGTWEGGGVKERKNIRLCSGEEEKNIHTRGVK